MTTPLPAPPAGSRNVGAEAAGLLPLVFAVFVFLHGFVHVIGFTTPWGLYTLRGVGYSTTILNGAIDGRRTLAAVAGGPTYVAVDVP
jgi:hypothetical protein